MATIVALNGQPLATVTLAEADESCPGRLPIRKVVEGSGRLLHYYFSQSERDVQLFLGDFRLSGRLQTKLTGTTRRWEVQLEPAHVVDYTRASAARGELPELELGA